MPATTTNKTEADHMADARARLIAAALPHVPFDGWSSATLKAAIADSGVDEALARLVFPRGALDLALAQHAAGDAALEVAGAAVKTSALRYSEKVARLVRLRIEGTDREVVRRGVTFFALPAHAADGAAAIWGTADLIWRLLGDTSDDFNWYSKRTILSAVYSSTLLYWLGDDSEGQADTWEFLDRRIGDVMQFEKAKAGFTRSPIGRALQRGPGRVLERLRAPDPHRRADLPGHVTRRD